MPRSKMNAKSQEKQLLDIREFDFSSVLGVNMLLKNSSPIGNDVPSPYFPRPEDGVLVSRAITQTSKSHTLH